MDCNKIFEGVRAEHLQKNSRGFYSFKSSLFRDGAGNELEGATRDIVALRGLAENFSKSGSKKKRPLDERALGFVPVEVCGSLPDNTVPDRPRIQGARAIDEFRDILSAGIVVHEVDWEDCERNAQLQKRLYGFLDSGIIKINNIPKIPMEYEQTGQVQYYGFDSEDNSMGQPHFYQFASRDNVFISLSFRLLFRYVVQIFELTGRNNVVWGTNIEYDLGNLLKDWDINKETCRLKWTKGGLKKFDLDYIKSELSWAGEEDIDGAIKVWDTLNHWKMGVKDIGKNLSEHLGYDFNKLDKDFFGFKYSAMDAILSRSYACVQKCYYDKKEVTLKFTPGATALNFYMQGHDKNGDLFCKHRLFDTHTTDELEWLIGGLRGGRTEVFSLKEYRGKIGYYDINSAYPYSMKFGVFPHPTKHRWVSGNRIWSMITAGYEGMIDCDVDATEVEEFVKIIPYLGTIEPKTGRYIFPLGKWRAKYTVFEIKKAIEIGYKFTFHDAILYEPSKYQPFAGFVDFCYSIRDEGTLKKDKILRDIGKSLGNNLYGKFGQRLRFTELENPDQFKPEDIAECIRIGNGVLIEKDEGFAPHSNVIWSVYITAICRDLLYGHMLKAWAAGNEVLYCDTDSIFIYGGNAPESHQTNLGALKHEGDLSYFKAFLPKTYVYEIDEKICYKAKGVPEDQKKLFLTQGVVEYKKPMKIREAMRRKNFNEKDADKNYKPGMNAINAWVTMTKELKGKYTKRIRNEDGSTTPIILKG